MVECYDCKEHEGILLYSDTPMMAITHGYGVRICRCCYVKRIEKAVIKAQKNLEKQKQLLKENGCK